METTNQNEFEDAITSNVVRETFKDSIMENGCSDKWAMFICGRLVNISGKSFFDSREQATKAFYNAFHWRAGREIQRSTTNSEFYWWSNPHRRDYWEAFKKVIKDKYDFKIVRV